MGERLTAAIARALANPYHDAVGKFVQPEGVVVGTYQQGTLAPEIEAKLATLESYGGRGSVKLPLKVATGLMIAVPAPNEVLTHGKPTVMRLKDLTATTHVVELDHVRRLLAGRVRPRAGSFRLPIVVRQGHRNLLVDGHARIVARWARGYDTALVQLVSAHDLQRPPTKLTADVKATLLHIPQPRSLTDAIAISLEAEWDESLHPRDDDGKFTESEGGGGRSTDPAQQDLPGIEIPHHQKLIRDADASIKEIDAGLLETAIENADFDNLGTGQTNENDDPWEGVEFSDLSSHDQNAAKELWVEENRDRIAEKVVDMDGWIHDHMDQDAILADAKEVFVEQFDPKSAGLDPDFKLKPESLDHAVRIYGMPEAPGIPLYSTMALESLRKSDGTKDGVPLTFEEREVIANAFNRTSDRITQEQIDTLRDSDEYQNAFDAATDEAIDEAWDNLNDYAKLSIAQEQGAEPPEREPETSSFAPGPPDTYAWDHDASDSDSALYEEDYLRTGAIVRSLATERTDQIMTQRGLYPKDGGGEAFRPASGLQGSPDYIAGRVWNEWKTSSTSGIGLALQLAASEELGAVSRLTPEQEKTARYAAMIAFTRDTERADLPLDIRDVGKAEPTTEEKLAKYAAAEKLGMERLKAYTRAQWEATQWVLDKAGDKEIEMYRAVHLPIEQLDRATKEVMEGEKYIHGGNYTRFSDLSLKRNSVASATMDRNVANSWGGVDLPNGGEGLRRVVIRYKVPREAVFSLPVFGQNIHAEREIVVLGAKDGIKWDAWEQYAPPFEKAPITLRMDFADDLDDDDDDALKEGTLVIDMQKIEEELGAHWLDPKFLPPKPAKKKPAKKAEPDEKDLAADWDESLHPRDDIGRFAESEVERAPELSGPHTQKLAKEADAAAAAIEDALIARVTKDVAPPKKYKWDASFKDDPVSEPKDENYVRTRAMVRAIATERTDQLLKQRGLYPYGSRPSVGSRVSPESIAERAWHQWKVSSTSGLGLSMQLAVSEELGALNRLSPDHERIAREAASEFAIDAEADGAQKLGMERLKAYVRAQWETTQWALKKAGTDEIQMYRAVFLPVSDISTATQEEQNVRGAYGMTKLPDISLKRNSVASATMNSLVANSWQGVDLPNDGVRRSRVVIRYRVPREAVFSLPVFGQNMHAEREVVLLGTKDGVKWDAWKGEAPEINKVPIRLRMDFADTAKADDDQQPVKPGTLVIDMMQIEEELGAHWLDPKFLPSTPARKARVKRDKAERDKADQKDLSTDWNEDLHPRDDDGKFTESGSTEAGTPSMDRIIGGHKLSGPEGSNPGGRYRAEGREWYAKHYRDPEQAYGEHLTDRLLRDAGVGAPRTAIGDVDGETWFASEIVTGDTLDRVGLSKPVANALLDGYVADAFVANWDAIGLVQDNVIVTPSGGVVRIDQGGALLHRAQGARKPTAGLGTVGEWTSLADPDRGGQYVPVFNAAGVSSPDALGDRAVAQIDRLLKIPVRAGSWSAYVNRVIPDAPARYRADVAAMLESRTHWLREKRAALAAKDLSATWDESEHPRDESGRFTYAEGGRASTAGNDEDDYLLTPNDAFEAIRAGRPATIVHEDLRGVVERAVKTNEAVDLAKLTLEGMAIFAGGLNLPRSAMPQIPSKMKKDLFADLKADGVMVTHERVNPMDLAPTQKEISALRTGEQLRDFEKGKRNFGPIIISKDNKVLDGHHRWSMAVVLALDRPGIRIPTARIGLTQRAALKALNAFARKRGISRVGLSARLAAAIYHLDWNEELHPRADDGKFVESTGGAGGDVYVDKYAVGREPRAKSDADLYAKLTRKLDRAESLGQAKFLLPDGKPLSHKYETHAQALYEIGEDLDDAMRRGLVRVSRNGVETSSRITHAQADAIVEVYAQKGIPDINVDLFLSKLPQFKREYKRFDVTAEGASDRIHAWVSATLSKHDLRTSLTERVRQALALHSDPSRPDYDEKHPGGGVAVAERDDVRAAKEKVRSEKADAELYAKLKHKFEIADHVADAKFLLPDGTGLIHYDRTHDNAMYQIEEDLYDTLRRGVIRVSYSGVETGGRITRAQADAIVEVYTEKAVFPIEVDLFWPEKHTTKGFDDYGRTFKAFDVRDENASDKIYAWVSAQYSKRSLRRDLHGDPSREGYEELHPGGTTERVGMHEATHDAARARIEKIVPKVYVHARKPTTARAATVVAGVLEKMQEQGLKMPDSVSVHLAQGTLRAAVRGVTIREGAASIVTSHTMNLDVDIPEGLPDDANLDDAVRAVFSAEVDAKDTTVGRINDKVAISPNQAKQIAAEGDPLYSKYDRFAARTMEDIVVHEMGHVQAGHRDELNVLPLLSSGLFPSLPAIRRAMLRVSVYASNNTNEFLAEAFTRLYRGETLPDDSMKLYRALDGPKVRWRGEQAAS